MTDVQSHQSAVEPSKCNTLTPETEVVRFFVNAVIVKSIKEPEDVQALSLVRYTFLLNAVEAGERILERPLRGGKVSDCSLRLTTPMSADWSVPRIFPVCQLEHL